MAVMAVMAAFRDHVTRLPPAALAGDARSRISG
jgi:hypothetical protein